MVISTLIRRLSYHANLFYFIDGKNILIPTRVKRGRKIELEYQRHLHCCYNTHVKALTSKTHTEKLEYKFNGVQRPAFFDRDDEVFIARSFPEEQAFGEKRVPFYDELYDPYFEEDDDLH